MTQETSAPAGIVDNGREQHNSTDTRLLLMKEYTAKFQQLFKEAQSIGEALKSTKGRVLTVSHVALEELLQRLKPPALDLARHVSQHIEHGEMGLPERLEYRLRLAEFEQAIKAADMMIAAIMR